MRTAIECLAKATEMEQRASRCAVPAERGEFRDAATRWRDLARRAWIHEQGGVLGQSKG
jgi:hypothetical protein